MLLPALAFHAHLHYGMEQREQAGALADELLERLPSKQSALRSQWTPPLAYVLSGLDRTADFEKVATSALISTRWLEAASAFAAGRFEEAASVLAEMGAVADEALLRLRAAEALVEAGRRPEADVHLQRALVFYRSVGATGYIGRAEGLFAASA